MVARSAVAGGIGGEVVDDVLAILGRSWGLCKESLEDDGGKMERLTSRYLQVKESSAR